MVDGRESALTSRGVFRGRARHGGQLVRRRLAGVSAVVVLTVAVIADTSSPAHASYAGACAGTSTAPTAFADAGPAADCLRAYNVALGKNDGTFGEGDLLLRSQVSSFLARFVQLAGITLSGSQSFSDVNPDTVPNDQVRLEIGELAASGIIAGFPDGTFRPSDNLSVAQAATLVLRAMQAIHSHNSSSPDMNDQGSTSANVPYTVHVGLLDLGAIDVHGLQYEHQASDTTKRGLLADIVAQAIQQLVNTGVASPFAPPPSAGQRSTVDRPDEQRGYQIHVVYATPADGPDNRYDTGGQIGNAIAAFNTWLSGQTGGSSLRIDTFQGAPDISFARLPRNDSDYIATNASIRDEVQKDLHQMGFNDFNKIYAVFWDGGSNFACGGGAWPPTLVGNVAAMYLRGTPPGAPPCDTNILGASATTPGYLEFAMLHEVMHTLGLVATCAPHEHGSGHVSDSNTDLMWQGPQPWMPDTLDIGHDDYFQAGNPNCLDLSNSAFLSPLPASPNPPPGWP